METIEEAFTKYYPEPVTLKKETYESNKEAIDTIAEASGYKYVGEKMNLAVFSSKK